MTPEQNLLLQEGKDAIVGSLFGNTNLHKQASVEDNDMTKK